MTRIAIIDMGTNTFHLLIAEKEDGVSRIVYRDYEAVKIGKGGINEGLISEAACERALNAMRKFRRFIDEQGVHDVQAFGTSALRNARNAMTLTEEIRLQTGIPVRIISGEEEADYIFAGVRAAMDLGDRANLVMDIGAGSVEFIIGDRQRILWKESFEIGGQRLLERFQKHDPISGEEVAALDRFFDLQLAPLRAALGQFRPEVLVGSSGTFDTLSEIYCRRANIPFTGVEPETPLTMEAFTTIHDELIHKSRTERMQIEGMIEMRVDMIVVACCLIRYILDIHTFRNLRVSSWSLKEGVLAGL